MNVKVDDYHFLIGQPDCGKMQKWPVYHDPQVSSKIFLVGPTSKGIPGSGSQNNFLKCKEVIV